MNVYWEPQTLRIPDGGQWRVVMDTEQEDGGVHEGTRGYGQDLGRTVRGEVYLAPRSVQVLVRCGA